MPKERYTKSVEMFQEPWRMRSLCRIKGSQRKLQDSLMFSGSLWRLQGLFSAARHSGSSSGGMKERKEVR